MLFFRPLIAGVFSHVGLLLHSMAAAASVLHCCRDDDACFYYFQQ